MKLIEKLEISTLFNNFYVKILNIGILFFLISSHPSVICLSLIVCFLLTGFQLKRTRLRISIYVFLIIFVRGILLLLFYLTITISNKPSWNYSFYLLLILIIPNFFISMKLSNEVSLRTLINDLIVFLILIMLYVLLMISYFCSQINFIRQI